MATGGACKCVRAAVPGCRRRRLTATCRRRTCQFHLAPNPERADRLWAAEVVPLEDATLATQPLARTSSISADGSGAMSMPESTSVPAQPQKVRSYTPGCRVYVGRLPPEAGWRELQELFFSFGELVHVQLPLDDNGRRRGFAIVELEQPEAASAAVAKLELAGSRTAASRTQ